MSTNRPLGITIVAALMVIFGLAEIATGITGNFIGVLSVSPTALSTYSAVLLGTIYAIGGLLVLTMRKREAKLAIVCLLIVIIGRVLFVATGLYPVSTLAQISGIVVGTGLAAVFAVYIKIRWNSFA